MSDEQTNPKTTPPKKKRRKLIAIATGTALIAGSAIGVKAFAESKTFSHMSLAASDGVGWHKMGRHRRHDDGHRFERMSEADMEAKVTRMVRHAAIEIDATPEQEEKLLTLASALAKDLMPLRGQMRTLRSDVTALLTAETIDREAIDTLRKDRLAEMDRISKTVLTAAADVADVLTPEQREIVNDRIKKFSSGRRGGHRGWRHH